MIMVSEYSFLRVRSPVGVGHDGGRKSKDVSRGCCTSFAFLFDLITFVSSR